LSFCYPGSEPEFAIPTKIDSCAMHVFERLIDVLPGCVTPAAGAAIVFFASKIGAGASQQFHGLSKAAPAIEVVVHARMIIEILSVNHGGPINFGDGGFHFAIGLSQVARYIGLLADTQQELSPAQVAAGVQIGGVAAGRVRINGSWNDCSGQTDQAERKGS
jgi:hypothetical protein